MSAVFPYGISFSDREGVSFFPAARTTILAPNGERLTLMLLLDSGATISALPKSDAAALGINLTVGTPINLVGAGREPIRGWRHDLTLQIGDERISVPVALLDVDESPRVLGREGIFDRFTIVIEEQRRRSACLRTGSPEALRVAGALDSVGAR